MHSPTQAESDAALSNDDWADGDDAQAMDNCGWQDCHSGCFDAFDDCLDECSANPYPGCTPACHAERRACLRSCNLPCL